VDTQKNIINVHITGVNTYYQDTEGSEETRTEDSTIAHHLNTEFQQTL